MFKKLFSPKTKNLPIIEKKNATLNQLFVNYFSSDGDNKLLTIKKALHYYDQVAPVATAIDIVNDEFKTLTLAMTDGDKIIKDHPVLKFLKQPNDDQVQVDFLENMGNFFLVTNEVYLIATGRPDREPAEVFVESPEHVDVKTDGSPEIQRFEVRRKADDFQSAYTEIFYRDTLSYRFFNKDKTAEIWQIKGFNTRKSIRGRSRLSSAVYEIEQYLEAAKHNLNLLRNGVRSTGAYISDEPLTEEQFDRLRTQIHETQAGAMNAGKSIILEGGMDYKEMSMTPKDMDFAKLKKDTMEAIFRRYKVPLALVSTDQMAESTMEASALALYDNVVLPTAKRLFDEIARFLAPRYNLTEKDKIIPFLDDITALQIRRVKEVKNKKEIGAFTIDEIRKTMGAEPLPDGKGEELYIPRNLVKIGEENNQAITTGQQGQDNRQPEGDMDMESDTRTDDERMKSKERYVEILKAQKTKDGNRLFTDKEIKELSDENF